MKSNYLLRPWSATELIDFPETPTYARNLAKSFTKSMKNINKKDSPDILSKHISIINNQLIRVLLEKLFNAEKTRPIDGEIILE